MSIRRLAPRTPKGLAYPDSFVALEIELADGGQDLLAAADVENPLHLEPSWQTARAMVVEEWDLRGDAELCLLRRDAEGRVLRIGLARGRSLRIGGTAIVLRREVDYLEVDLSGDLDQEYLTDGITESIISTLSKIPEVFVIARNSVFTYKGKPVKVQQVSEELGVRYILEGSVQRSGDQVRVSAQLIDATSGLHLWSEQYDRDVKELFALQDEITHKIVIALQVELTEGEQARVRHRSTNNLKAWGYAVRGYSLFQHYTKEDNARARELFEEAIKLDPEYAWAWTYLAWTHWIDARFGYGESRDKSFSKAVETAQKAQRWGQP